MSTAVFLSIMKKLSNCEGTEQLQLLLSLAGKGGIMMNGSIESGREYLQYVMECLKSNTTQVRNIKQYLLATLYNAPTTIDSYYAAQVRHDFGWGGRSN